MFTTNGEQNISIAAINSNENRWKLEQSQVGYKRGDHDMSAGVTSLDETLWKNNQNKTSGVLFY